MAKLTKVACLYRVSTKKQVEENDIPMQKNACNTFIDSMSGWVLAQEYYEKGVSGYHKSAEQRDILQQVRADAESGLFDVLLVFMFDRLGRREDETPFIVEWFVGQGIEVWSVKEGQQRFENRADKLINYIRFWQSGGESEKTSMRVKEKHKQMVEDGIYRGGAPAYGYDLIDSDKRRNQKGYRLKEIVINEKESEVVKLIYNLACEKGYGGKRIADYLNERGIKTKPGNYWTAGSVLELMKNPIYKGYYVSGKRPSTRGESKRVSPEHWIHSDKLPHLIIVDDHLWDTAEAIRNSRTAKTGKYPMKTNGRMLFTSMARCGSCGARMSSVHAIKKWSRKTDNTEIRYLQPKYICQGRRASIPCTGQKSFSQRRVDPVIMEEVCAYLDTLQTVDLSPKIDARQGKIQKNIEVDIREAKAKIAKAEKELDVLSNEVVKTLTNESNFTSAQLYKIITKKEDEIQKQNELAKELSARLIKTFAERKEMIANWRNELESSSVEVQRMLLSSLIESVVLSKDRLDVNFKFDLFKLEESDD